MIKSASTRTFSRARSEEQPGLDPWMLVSAGALLFLGLASLYSIDTVREGRNFFSRQLLNAIIGIIPFIVLYRVRLNTWIRFAPVIYVVNLALLGAVLAFGTVGGGAQRWINIGFYQFQPSELSKLFIVLTLSAFYANRLDKIHKLSTFLLGMAHVAIPAMLIRMQPHLGAMLSLFAIWVVISVYAGVPGKFLGVMFGMIVLAGGIAVTVPGVLQDYQMQRIQGLLDPDPRGDGYQQARARMAFGVGGITGTGFLQGEQKIAFPEQQNDFILTLVGEEGGLAGVAMVAGLFGILLFRIWLTGYNAPNSYARMVASGVLAIIGFHALINMGMVLGILPVVGLWLPFMSQGGTALQLCMGCLGLLCNIRREEENSWLQ